MTDTTFPPSLADPTRFAGSGDSVMSDTQAVPVSFGCETHAPSADQVPASNTPVLPPLSTSLSNGVASSKGLERNTADAQPLQNENNNALTQTGNGKIIRTVNVKGRATGGIVIFPNLTPSSRAEIMQSEDLSRYVVDAPPLPGQGAVGESSSRDKGKGKATDAPSSSSAFQIKAPATPHNEATQTSYAVQKITSSVERRAANYTVTHPPGWFDNLPPINDDLFKDSPHHEYKMVLIHTARCNVCLQYNKGTLFMCADCTVSICEGCADRKCGVGVENDADREDVAMAEGNTGGEDADAETFAAAESATAGGHVAITEAGEAVDAAQRRLDWCGPYHEIFRSAYLEWKAVGGGRDDFVSAEGVEFKASTGKMGGRKRKAS
jgi:hypothetical protein